MHLMSYQLDDIGWTEDKRNSYKQFLTTEGHSVTNRGAIYHLSHLI